MSLFTPAIEQLWHELEGDEQGGVVFARVTRVVAKKEHRLPDDRKGYSHYFGFADQLDSTSPVRLWFKRDAALEDGMYLGPVTHRPDRSTPPATGSIIMGRVVRAAKGCMLLWWVPKAEPFLKLRDMLAHSTKMKRTSSRLHSMLTNDASVDDLYVMARVLLFSDVSVLVDQLRSEEAREPHAGGRKAGDGYTVQRGYTLTSTPVEFAYLLAQLTLCPLVYTHFLDALRAAKDLTDPDPDLSRFPVEALPEADLVDGAP